MYVMYSPSGQWWTTPLDGVRTAETLQMRETFPVIFPESGAVWHDWALRQGRVSLPKLSIRRSSFEGSWVLFYVCYICDELLLLIYCLIHNNGQPHKQTHHQLLPAFNLDPCDCLFDCSLMFWSKGDTHLSSGQRQLQTLPQQYMRLDPTKKRGKNWKAHDLVICVILSWEAVSSKQVPWMQQKVLNFVTGITLCIRDTIWKQYFAQVFNEVMTECSNLNKAALFWIKTCKLHKHLCCGCYMLLGLSVRPQLAYWHL